MGAGWLPAAVLGRAEVRQGGRVEQALGTNELDGQGATRRDHK